MARKKKVDSEERAVGVIIGFVASIVLFAAGFFISKDRVEPGDCFTNKSKGAVVKVSKIAEEPGGYTRIEFTALGLDYRWSDKENWYREKFKVFYDDEVDCVVYEQAEIRLELDRLKNALQEVKDQIK